jgi:hypothetical protein
MAYPPGSDERKGFAGLDEMVSDISEETKETPKVTTIKADDISQGTSETPRSERPSPGSSSEDKGQKNSRAPAATVTNTSKLKRVCLITVIITVIWLVGAAVMASIYEKERELVCLQTEGTLEGLQWCESDIFLREDLGFGYKDLFVLGLSWPSHLISSDHDSVEILTEIANSNEMEEMPSVGKNQVLNEPQIRWCIFERERLRMMEMITDTYQERNVYNKSVSRHKDRCTSFQSRQSTLDAINKELLFEGKRLQSEGAQRIFLLRSSPENTEN